MVEKGNHRKATEEPLMQSGAVFLLQHPGNNVGKEAPRAARRACRSGLTYVSACVCVLWGGGRSEITESCRSACFPRLQRRRIQSQENCFWWQMWPLITAKMLQFVTADEGNVGLTGASLRPDAANAGSRGGGREICSHLRLQTRPPAAKYLAQKESITFYKQQLKCVC